MGGRAGRAVTVDGTRARAAPGADREVGLGWSGLCKGREEQPGSSGPHTPPLTQGDDLGVGVLLLVRLPPAGNLVFGQARAAAVGGGWRTGQHACTG